MKPQSKRTNGTKNDSADDTDDTLKELVQSESFKRPLGYNT
jgi:hypothetical protein